MHHCLRSVAWMNEESWGAIFWMILREVDVSCDLNFKAHTYIETDTPHNTNTHQFLFVLFWYQVFVHCVSVHGPAAVTPP